MKSWMLTRLTWPLLLGVLSLSSTAIFTGCSSGGDDDDSVIPEETPAPESPVPTATPQEPSPTPSPAQPASLDVSSRIIDFGNVTLGADSSAEVILTNGGGRTLTYSLWVADVEGGYFSLGGDQPALSGELAPEASITYEVVFSPTREGSSTGLLTIASNDGLEPKVLVDLGGRGLLPDLDGDGYSSTEGDCDDDNPDVHPGALEVCEPSGTPPIDNNCDGQLDEGLSSLYYPDLDGDGYGDSSAGSLSCLPAAGQVTLGEDCDDGDPERFPGNVEVCDGKDNDCNDQADDGLPQATYYTDADGDGYGQTGASLQSCGLGAGVSDTDDDCNDTDPQIHPGAAEPCDTIDNDCDGSIDEEGASTYYTDSDGDGYGADGSSQTACNPGPGLVVLAGDCDDQDAGTHPDAAEACDGVDQDCDGQIDDGVTVAFYADGDGDGYGAGDATYGCSAQSGQVDDQTDCDDGNPTIHPGATESCDGVDQDCDGVVDNGALNTYYLDSDGDGYGDPTASSKACALEALGGGYVANAQDCDDSDSSIHPAAAEVCEAPGTEPVDNDCDGSIDEGVATTYYLDQDGDEYGDITSATNSCTEFEGYITRGSDCDDLMWSINPNGLELCNGLDDDCDGLVDSDDTFAVTEDNLGAFNLACDTYDSVAGAEVPYTLITWPQPGQEDGMIEYFDSLMILGHVPGAQPAGDWPVGCTFYDEGIFWFDTRATNRVYLIEACFSVGTADSGGDELYLRIAYDGEGIVGTFSAGDSSQTGEPNDIYWARDEGSEDLQIWYLTGASRITGVDIDGTLAIYDARAVLTLTP